MKTTNVLELLSLLFVHLILGPFDVHAWTELPVQENQLVFVPGSQQGTVSLESATRCDNCHGGCNKAVEPAHNWRGSMMANAGDLCIRCHTPTGWLGGHSNPPNLAKLAGSDFEGISCDACHKMVDPFRGIRQEDDLPPETAGSTALAEAEKTYAQDINVLHPLTLFNGNPFFDNAADMPWYFGTGFLPNYIESTSGQYVKFYNAENTLIGEINPCSPLVVGTDAQGNKQYVSGGMLTPTRDALVYESGMSSELTGEDHGFHFVLATDRVKDNRIPPKGFDIDAAAARLAVPNRDGEDAPGVFTAAEYAGGYDEATVAKPSGTARWEAALYYQTTSREYVEFLRDEIAGTGNTLPVPSPSGESTACIDQTDPYFITLKDWGKAIYDLRLYNDGSEPVMMASVGVASPCPAPPYPGGVKAASGKRRVTLSWTAVLGAAGYNVYYAQGGRYSFRARVTGTGYTDTGLTPGNTYCYAVSTFVDCGGQEVESETYSQPVCAVPTR